MIKVMTFNIRYGLAKDGVNEWRHRKRLVADRIRTFDPDLLGLQECRDDAQAEFVKQSLPEHTFYGVRREGPGDTALEMAPVLVRKSVFAVRQTGRFWLSETPDVVGSKSWDADFARTVTWAEVLHQPSGRTLIYANTHFDYRPIALAESARVLRRWIEQVAPKQPLIVTADFNADKHAFAYTHLADTALLFDALQRAHPDQSHAATFHGYGKPADEAPIDWILASSHFEVVDAAIDTYHEGELYPSDHYPVTATLTWK